MAREREDEGGADRIGRAQGAHAAGAGIAVVAGLPAARAEIAPKRFVHEGAAVEISGKGRDTEISVEGLGVEVVASNGAYRAVGFMYSPQPTCGPCGGSCTRGSATSP